MRNPIWRLVIVCLAILVSLTGLLLSVALTLEYHGEPLPQFVEDICVAFESSDCAEVARSRYAVFPPGAEADQPHVPTSLLGMFYFTAMLSWMVLVGSPTRSRWWAHLILVAGTVVGLGWSVFLDIKMWTDLPKFCPLCLGAHIASLLLVVFAVLLWPRRPRAQDEEDVVREIDLFCGQIRDPWPTARMIFATVVLAGVAIWGQFLWGRPTQQIDDLKRQLKTANFYKDYFKTQFERYDRNWQQAYMAWNLAPVIDIPIEGEPVRGPSNAMHTMVVFSDFECPHCKKFEDYLHRTIFPLGQSLGGLRLIFKHWPICQECNEFANSTSHPVACQASRALEAARIVGGDTAYWRMYDLLWARQSDWRESKNFGELAKAIGLNVDAFTQAFNSEESLERIRRNTAEGIELGKDSLEKEEDREFVKVSGTPTVFVDGKRVWRMHKRTSLWSSIFKTRPRPSTTATRPK